MPEPHVVIRAQRHVAGDDPGGPAPDYALVRGERAANPRVPSPEESGADRDACVAWVLRYLRILAPGERSTKRGSAVSARAPGRRPVYARFDQHGGWESVRRDALELAAEAARTPGQATEQVVGTVV